MGFCPAAKRGGTREVGYSGCLSHRAQIPCMILGQMRVISKLRWRLVMGVVSLAATLVVTAPVAAPQAIHAVADIWPNGFEQLVGDIWPNSAEAAVADILPNPMVLTDALGGN